MNLTACVGLKVGSWVDCGFCAVATANAQSEDVCRSDKWVTGASDDSSRSRLL